MRGQAVQQTGSRVGKGVDVGSCGAKVWRCTKLTGSVIEGVNLVTAIVEGKGRGSIMSPASEMFRTIMRRQRVWCWAFLKLLSLERLLS